MTSRAARVEPPLFTRDFVVLIVGHFLQALGYSSMLLLPLYLEHLQATRAQIGAIMATAAVAGLVTRPAVAWALDRLGRRPTLLFGTVTLSASMGLLAFVHEVSWLIYVERVFVGVGIGALFSGYFTYAADLVPPSRRTEGLALFGISGLVPLLVNPIADRLHVQAADLRWFLPVVGGVILLSLVPLLMLPASSVERAMERRPMREAVGELGQRRLWAPWLATVAFSGLVAIFMTYSTVSAVARGVERAPTLWLAYAVGAITVRMFGARLPDRVGPNKILAPALGLYIGAMFLTSVAGSLLGFLLAALLAGLGHGYCFPVLTSQVVSRTPETFRGTAIAMFTALWGLSELVVSPIFGHVADVHGDATMFNLAAALGLLALLSWALLERRFGEPALLPH